MNPNKKLLNSKNNSPWLLCPSKSFPGKFYYFNGSTGETAWSLTESDHNNIKTLADDTQAYPEPFGPPADESPTTSFLSTLRKDYTNNTNFNNSTNFSNKSSSSIQNVSAFNTDINFNPTNFSNQGTFSLGANLNGGRNFRSNINNSNTEQSATPMFGQAVFQTYVPSDKTTKVIWTLTPMLISEQPHRMLDQITQYEPPDTFLHAPMMLNNQFRQSQPQKSPFNVQTAKEVQTSSPLFSKVTYESKDVQTSCQETLTKEEACQTLEPETKEVETQLEGGPKPIIKPSRFGEKSTQSVSVGISTLSCRGEVDDAMEVVDDAANKMSALNKNDLRFVLEARRRKSIDLDKVIKTTKEASNVPKKQPENNVAKKRVTFDLSSLFPREEESDVIQENVLLDQNEPSTSMEVMTPAQPNRIWYIVPDTVVLLSDYEYIERNVINEQNCRLLIPFAVKAEIETYSRGECGAKHEALTARLIIRKLTKLKSVVLQDKPEKTSKYDEYSILDCCCQYSQDNSDVTLLTTSTELFEKAKLFGIDCSLFDSYRQEAIEPVTEPISLFDDKDIPLDKKRNTDTTLESTNTHKGVNDVNQPVLVDIDLSKLDITDEVLLSREHQSEVTKCKKLDPKEAKCDINERNVKDVIEVSGITKLNSVFNLDDELARYYVKNKVMEARLASRADEWKCRLIQATEDVLTDILIKENTKKNMPPLHLCDAIQKIGNTFKNQSKIKTITEKLSSHMQNCNFPKHSATKPADFTKLLGFCITLVQSLKEILDNAELNDADDLLSELIKHIEDPSTDVELYMDEAATPVPSESELEYNIPIGYKTKQADVLEYLKKHFTAMQFYQLEKTEPKIVRTIGKDLKSVKMLSNKAITMDGADVQVKPNVEPVVVKNFKRIEAFEEKLKNLKEEALVYEESLSEVISGRTYVVNDDRDGIYKNNGNKESDAKNHLVDDSILGESSSSDINIECIYAYPLMKAFLTELRRTLLLIYHLVSDGFEDLKLDSISENKCPDLEIKMTMAHEYILKIVDRLKSIIARESGQGVTLKMLLIQAGDFEEESEAMAHYKELIAKYLEQAEILEEALRIMLSIDHGELDAVASDETSSVILPQRCKRNSCDQIKYTKI